MIIEPILDFTRMDKQTKTYVDAFMADLIKKNPGENEFHQAVREVVESVAPVVMAYPYMREQKVLERMVEPERVVMFPLLARIRAVFASTRLSICQS